MSFSLRKFCKAVLPAGEDDRLLNEKQDKQILANSPAGSVHEDDVCEDDASAPIYALSYTRKFPLYSTRHVRPFAILG